MSTTTIKHCIRRLPKQLANQIAAGEVVERPASIVKELLENSIDAGATKIEVDIEQGGVRSILIRDNGCGIPGEQLSLAVSRHATSKISSLNDLENLYSMGFRGEALASIGSVSRMELTSLSEDDEQAWKLVCDNLSEDTEGELTVSSHPQGTSVHVSKLFYNAPARRKFLRSERTEYLHVEEVVRRIALSHFEIQFQLKHNQRQVFHLPAATDRAGELRRLQRLCGKAFTEKALYLEFEHQGLKLKGWLAPPSESRSQADLQYFFVNQRIIKDRVISHAIRQAYSDRIYPGRYPAYVLYLDMSPDKVDVNVHPTKHEVRFRESRFVHDFLLSCLGQALQDTLPQTSPLQQLDENTEPYYKSAEGNVAHSLEDDEAATTVAENLSTTAYSISDYQAQACLYERYILASHNQQWRLVEITKTLQQLYALKLQSAAQPLRSLPLLFPLSVQLEQVQANWCEQNQQTLLQWGMDINRISENDIMLRSLPTLLQDVDSMAFIKQVIEQKPLEQQDWVDVLATSAADAEQRQWTSEAMQLLLNQMQHYGLWNEKYRRRSLWQELEKQQLEKLFGQD